jgi:hypothetical protein
VLALVLAGRAWALDDRTYLGHLYAFEKAETYASILGGKVYLLRPGGNDVLHDTGWAVLIEGPISTETTRNVRTLLQRNASVRIIYLDSPGGDLFAGLELGQTIASSAYLTVVNLDAECASACALAFLAGKARMVLGQPEKFGFHRQYYIRNGQINYGNWSEDIATISTYLKGIAFSGLQADEIVGTTGLVTYSDRRLADRGIVTLTRSAHVRRLSVILKTTGATATEQYMASCFLQMVSGFDCGNTIVVFRLPLLMQFYTENPDQILDKTALRALGPTFSGIRTNADVSEVNCRLRGADYIAEVQARFTNLLNSSPSGSILESYRAAVEREVGKCTSQLQQAKPR